jgi:hypothetical protein
VLDVDATLLGLAALAISRPIGLGARDEPSQPGLELSRGARRCDVDNRSVEHEDGVRVAEPVLCLGDELDPEGVETARAVSEPHLREGRANPACLAEAHLHRAGGLAQHLPERVGCRRCLQVTHDGVDVALCLASYVVGVGEHPIGDAGLDAGPLELERGDLREQLGAGIGAGQRHVSNLDAPSDKAIRQRRR